MTTVPVEVSSILTVDFLETTWGSRGIRFGLSSFYTHGRHQVIDDDHPLSGEAERSLSILRRAYSICHTPERAFSFYNTGRCTVNAYGRLAASIHAQALRYWILRAGLR